MAKVFNFQKDDLVIEFIDLLTLSKATIDPKIKFKDSNGVEQKMSIPTSIARLARSALKNVTKFPKGYPACIGLIGGRIVAMEVATGPSYKMYKELGEWVSKIESNASILATIEGEWLWDGQYAYRYCGEIKQMGTTNFGNIEVRVFNTYKLGEDKIAGFETLAALCYKNPKTGEWVKTSPMTRNSGGFLQLTGDVEQFNKGDEFVDSEDSFNQINVRLFPNIRFVNYAAKVMANQFGYNSIQPLGLPLLMIEHQTFNIGGLPTEMQTASPAPMNFTSAMAWMIGWYDKVNNLTEMMAVKSVLKMLLSKGNTQYHSHSKDENEETRNTKELIGDLRKMAGTMELVRFKSLAELEEEDE